MGKSTVGIWLGLFAMLMIHLGPLYSALNSEAPVVVAMPAASGDAPAFCREPAAAAAPAAETEPAIYEAPPLVITGGAQHSPLTVVTAPRIT